MIAALLILAAVYGAAAVVVSVRNSRVNGALDADPKLSTRNRMIHHQNSRAGALYRFGLYHASYNACEVIAVHNAKLLLGISSSYSATVRDFQKAGAMVGLGVFGSNPYLIGRVLRRSGIPFCRLKKGELRGPGVYIVSFWNEGKPWHGLHTVAAYFNGESFQFYNFGGQISRKEASGSVFFENNYICSYFLP